MKSKKIVIRPYDRVKIINPEFFIRCGYPLSIKTAKQTLINQDDRNLIDTLLGISEHKAFYPTKSHIKAQNEMENALAYFRIKQNGFGGSERKIYTQTLEQYKDQILTVWSKRVVYTGKYIPGSNSMSWEGEPDYCPAYLQGSKAHVILNLGGGDGSILLDDDLQIEEYHVQKV